MATVACETCRASEKTIDDCYHTVLERLTIQGKIKRVSSHLMSVATNHERVLFAYNVLKELTLLPKVRINAKDDNVSMYYRCQGNTFFKHKKYHEAWQAYNLSLLYAVTTSENYIYAVSNRSAVFFGMQMYKECLEDIKYVFSTQFPEKLRDKLLEREKQSLSKLEAELARAKKDAEHEKKISEILKLKHSTDKKYIKSSTKLKLVYTEEMGRHVIANEDIAVGEVLVEEEPYLTVLLQPQFLFCCAQCLSRNMNLYPCTNCTYTFYCSEECRELAYKQYHSVECPLLPSLLEMEFSKLELLALRTLLRSRTDVEDWNTLFKTVTEAESRINTDQWGCVKEGDKWVYDSKYYTSIHTLASNVEKRSISDIFRKSISAAAFEHMLSVLNFQKSENEEMTRKAKRYVRGTLLLHIMTGPTNMHSISSTIANEEGKYVEEYQYASGAYAFLSLLNHSCTPNVVRYSKLGTSKMILVAIRPIKKGMQIFDNYGYHHAVQDRETRQKDLKFQYKFLCSCEACIDNWPMHANLKQAVGLPAGILRRKDECLSPRVIDSLMKADKETAIKYYKPLCELIEILDPFAPCKELAECQESLKQCLAIFCGVIPFEYTESLEWKARPPCAAKGDPPHAASFVSEPEIEVP